MLFGTNGVRGKFNELTPLLALKISQAVGTYFKKGKIGVARDGRLTGECLENSVVSGLLSVGCRVINFGIISSPTAEFMIKKLSLDGLIIITASHNPAEWNALKVVDGNGIAVSKERGGLIEKIMGGIRQASWDGVKGIENYSSAVEDHVKRIMEKVDCEKIKRKKPKIVLDLGNGTASTIAPLLFGKLGCAVITINEKIDGRFPGRPSEPTKENVRELTERVKKENADCGIAWDGDGDRVIFVDESGEFINGDKVFGISLKIKLEEAKGNIVTTVATSRLIEDIGNNHGIKTIYTKVGAPYLSEKMAKPGFIMGGEEVGGVIWPEISLAKDGIYTSAKIVEKICEKKLSKLAGELPFYVQEKTRIEIKENEMQKILKEVEVFAEKKNLPVINIDGVRINFENGWAIARASGTEPVIRVFAEGKTKDNAQEILKMIQETIKSARA